MRTPIIIIGGALGLAWAASLAGCPDARCSVENERTLVNTCRLRSAAVPTPCAILLVETSDGNYDPMYEAGARACLARGSGACIDCLARAAKTCEETAQPDAGQTRVQAIARCCQNQDEACCGTSYQDRDCLRTCWTSQTACSDGCKADAGVQACFDCGAKCDEEGANCERACPRT